MRKTFCASIMIIVGVFTLANLTGCLKTRSDAADDDQHQIVGGKVAMAQKEPVDPATRISENDETIRDLRGRVEVLETKSNANSDVNAQSRKNLEEQNKDLQHRLGLMQETVTKLDLQVQTLSSDITQMKADIAANAKAGADAKNATKNTFEAGMEAFNKKDYKKAILIFQAFREKKPKDKNIPEATYRIGLSFQELGMKDEATTFYEETIAKNPKSDVAKRAKARLTKLKNTK